MIIEVIGLGVIVPVLEECLYRGVIFRRIRDMVDARKAIFVFRADFCRCAWKYCTVLYAFVFGLLLSYAYETYESIKAPVCCTVQQILAQCF